MAGKKTGKKGGLSLIRGGVIGVPETREAAEGLLLTIGSEERERREVAALYDEKIQRLQEEHAGANEPFLKRISACVLALYLYAKRFRAELTGKAGKTAKLRTGTLSWKLTRGAVEVDDEDKAVEYARKHKLDRFIKVTYSLDKTAMLHDPEAAERIPGVSIVQEERFYLKSEGLGEEIFFRVSDLDAMGQEEQ